MEYTEEIERLRHDLAATSEKNGVYMDEGEYKRITMKLASLEKENSEKTAHLKALREKMEKMEEWCNMLNMEVSEKQSELIRKTEILTETEDCLERTKSILVSTEMEKQLQERLVSYHEDKEKQLSKQAHSLLMVADQSTKDALILKDKLSRERLVEEENKRRWKQFGEKIQKHLKQMEWSLGNLTSEHTSICENLLTTLGDRQEQVTSELTIISELITRQKQLFMDLLHNMEQKSVAAMPNAQLWVQSHLAFIQSSGTSAEDCRTSIMELIEPLKGISKELHKAMMNLQVLSNEVHDQVKDSENRLEVYSLEINDACNGIEESMAHYAAQRKQESERFATVRRNIVEDSDAEDREMLSQLRVVAQTVQRLDERLQARLNRTNQSDAELHDGLNHMDALTANMAGEMQRTAGSLKKKLTKFVTDEKQTTEELQCSMREFVEKLIGAVNHMEHLREEAVTGCWSALSSHEEERRQYYQSTEEQLQDHS